MQTKNIKVGIVVANRVNGKIYSITDAKDELIVLSQQENGEIVPDTEIKVGIDSLGKCFTFIEDPNPAETPEGFTVEGGILKRNGSPATTQGEIEFVDLLGAIPGLVVLTAKTRDKADDAVDVFTYDPANDAFKKIIRAASSVKVVYRNDSLYLEELETRIEKIEKEDGKTDEIKTVEGLSLVEVAYEDKNPVVKFNNLFGTADTVKFTESAIVVESKNTLTFNEDGLRVLEPVKEGVTLTIIRDGFAPTPLNLPDEIDSVTEQVDGGSLVIIAGNTMYYENLGYRSRMVTNAAVKEIQGYPYLVSCDIRNGSEKYVFADSEYRTKTLSLKKTFDRGNIITVE